MNARGLAKVFGATLTLCALASGRRADADPLSPQVGGPGVYAEMGQGEADPLTGAYRYGFEFDLPTARGRAQPKLSLRYNSSNADREAGYGWGLEVPVIERRVLSGWVQYDDTDRFMYNGQPLALVCTVGVSCAGNEELPTELNGWRYYRAQVEGAYARFFFSVGTQTEWIVQLHNGVEMRFGAASAAEPPWGGVPAFDAERDNTTQVARFYLSSMRDPYANNTYYRWRRLGHGGRVYLTDIFDTSSALEPSSTTTPAAFAHHTQLDWEVVPYRVTSYAHADRAGLDMRLTRVAVASSTWGGAGERKVVRGWQLNYLAQRMPGSYDSSSQGPLFHHSFLRSIETFGCSEQFENIGVVGPTQSCPRRPAISFEYEPGNLLNTGVVNLGQSFVNNLTWVEPIDGLPAPNQQQEGRVLRARYQAESTGFDVGDEHKAIHLGLTDAALFDANRDGLPDFLQGWHQDATYAASVLWLGAHGLGTAMPPG
jgi:hypothetical protein